MEKKETLNVVEFFGGIGAIRKALIRQNIPHKVLDYVEIDPFAVDSYNEMYDEHFEPQDISKWDKEFDEEVDLIMHGSPCQDFSLAGKQKGGDEGSGTRSSLMYETIRIVKKLKPKYVIWENVKNIISKKHIHNFNNYLNIMDDVGYNNYYQILNSKDYGVPQNRERVFTVSIRKDIDDGRFEFPQKEPLTLRIKDVLEKVVDEKYYLSDKKISSISQWKSYQKPFERVLGKNSISPTLTARGAGEEHAGMITYSETFENTTNIQEQLEHKQEKNKKEQLCDYMIENNLVEEYDVINHSYTEHRFESLHNKKNIASKNISPTLTTRPDELGIVVNTSSLRIRKLTPKECWRLMGFDDEDFEKAEKVNSNAQLYKQARKLNRRSCS